MPTDRSQYFRSPKPRPIMVPKLHHATFMTMDVDAMVKFYEAVCGLQPVYYAEHAAWMSNDEANNRIALLRLPGTHPRSTSPTASACTTPHSSTPTSTSGSTTTSDCATWTSSRSCVSTTG